MELTCFLIVNAGGQVRCTKSPPALQSNEVPLRLSIEIPDALFEKPRLEATIKVPEELACVPGIAANVIPDMQEAIQQSVGLDVQVVAVNFRDETGTTERKG